MTAAPIRPGLAMLAAAAVAAHGRGDTARRALARVSIDCTAEEINTALDLAPDRDATMPPSTEYAEAALLGTILLRPELGEYILAAIEPEDILLPHHRLVLLAMRRARDEGRKPDPVVVLETLRAMGVVAMVGGGSGLDELMAVVWAPSYWPEYARLIRESRSRRDALDGAIVVGATAADEVTATMPDVRTAVTALATSLERGIEHSAPTSMHEAIAEEMQRTLVGDAGHPTGLRALDRSIGGLVSGELVVLASRPSMGKSALGQQIAVHVAGTGVPVVVVTLEMSAREQAARSMAAASGVSTSAWRRGMLAEGELTALHARAAELARLPLWFVDAGLLHVDDLRARLHRFQADRGLGLVVIDYLQLLRPSSGERRETREAEVADVSRHLKALAKDLGVAVLALAQLNRACEMRADRRPMLSDLRESGSVEQDTDVVLLLYREEYYLRERTPAELRGVAELNVAKHRAGGVGVVKLHWEPRLTRFADLANAEPDVRFPEDA